MKQGFIVFIILVVQVNSLMAQNIGLGSWNTLNLKYTIDDQWSAFGESQLRSLKFYNDFHYYEYKGGLNYKLNKNATLTLGAGSYQTYKEGGNFRKPKNNDEFRVWPQINLFQSLGKFKIEQRYRAELRFTNTGYRNRFRYRLGIAFPFGKLINNYYPFQISTNNELFFTDNEPYFERNRMQLALNYKPSKATTLQIGYLHQFDYKINDETGRDFLQVGYFIELFRKQTKSRNYEIDLKDN